MLAINMATGLWRGELNEVELQMLEYSESLGLVPYAGTPSKCLSEEDARAVLDGSPSPTPDPDSWRLTTTAWCSCKRCGIMPTPKECICCRECPPAVATRPGGCITEHNNFAPICLQPGVLEVAFWALQEAGRHPAPREQKLRFAAYHQFVRWMWRRLGRRNRRVLPACVVKRIHDEFPSETYTGFHDVE
ncbi:uncharacterized protein LOC120844056 isoform X2 [Ixodes scapularis]|uniref:uncharacterized protein LOC120844056 isoform X2 n=2 Tax=Ixodes scapularis TaxID=6945 RepID=UPI001C3949FC|nr:uncharacterized protein LOC120844056 isoform X2 [Ixodes scapularis]